MMRGAAALMLLMAVAGPFANPAAPEPVAPRSVPGPTEAPGGEVSRLLELEASVSVDETGHRMSASARLSLEVLKSTSRLFLRLNPAMNVSHASADGLGPMEVARSIFPFISLQLGATVEPGAVLRVTLSYSGEVAYSEDGNETYWDYIGPEGSWVRSYGWFLPAGEGWERARARIALTVPEGRAGLGPGELVGELHDPPNGTATFVWESEAPSLGVSFTVGSYALSEFSAGERVYRLYLRPDHSGAASSFAGEIERIVSFYTGLFGPPSFRNLTVVEVPNLFSAWGQSLPSMLWLASRNFEGPLPYRILSHELGHQWWGVDVEAEGAGESWLREGFAGYAEAMYEMETYGSRGYLEFCRQRYIDLFVASGGPEPLLVGSNYDLASYKGPWVLHMLRYILGGADFNRSLSSFHEERAGTVVNLYDFKAHVERAVDRDLSEFFYFWLFSQGRLDYAIARATSYEGEGGRRLVEAEVESRAGEAGAPLDAALLSAGETVEMLPYAWNGSGRSWVLRHEVGTEVDTLRIDPQGWLLDVSPSSNEAPLLTASLDISVTGIEPRAEKPMENESFPVAVTVRSASSEAPPEVEVAILSDGALSYRSSIVLPAEGEATIETHLSLPAGSHELRALLDPGDLIYERSESNNALSISMEVLPRPPALPDLRVAPGSISLPSGAVGGERAALSAALENLGRAPAGPSAVDFWLEEGERVYLGRSLAPALEPGGRAVVSVEWATLPGRHVVSAVADAGGEIGEGDEGNNALSMDLYVNARPVALLTAEPGEAGAWEWVEFSGARSLDDGAVARFLFDFGDGETSGWLADPSTSHCYGRRGSYRARLMVMDDAGAESDWSPDAVVKVLNSPPEAALEASARVGTVRTLFRFTSRSLDPDGEIREQLWSFGDGATAAGPCASHTYSRKGVFTVVLTVTDEEGASSSASLNLSVRNLPPEPFIEAEGLEGLVGRGLRFSAARSTDPDDPPSGIEFYWEFDGQRVPGAEVSITFTRPGVHRVVLTASDGASSSEASALITIRAPPEPQERGGAGWQSWAILAALLAVVALTIFYITVPYKPQGQEEE
ncbi:MAG: PKD domain-containing protein [Thermoplasmatota archaeon]